MLPPPARLYTLGPPGTFSDKAAQRLRAHLAAGGARAPAIDYTRTIPEVLERTQGDPEALGVFPIENSDTGTVLFAQDSLVQHCVTIEWEIALRVRFALLANAPPGEVTRVLSQPVAYDQCGFYLARHLPKAQVSFTTSNTESGLQFLAEREGGPSAAIVPVEFAAEHPALRVAEDIQNYPNNTTRFLVVRAAPGPVAYDFSRHKTSILIEPEEDRPGLLYDLLSVFKRHELNLCRLESRPAKVRPWTYVFFMDFNNNAGSAEALAELQRGDRTIRILGSYDRLE
jgi:chorismate mutase/prephenate dehydratase